MTQIKLIGKLYWVADQKPPQNIENAFFFNIDNVSASHGLSKQILTVSFCLGLNVHAFQQGLRPPEPCYGSQVLS